MKLAPNFEPAMYHFWDKPKTNYHWLHRGKDTTKRTVGTFRWLSEMSYWLSQSSQDEYNHYISPYHYDKLIRATNYIGGNRVDVNSVATNKIYMDFDPLPGENDCIYMLPKLRELQKKIPTTIIFSGRGYQTYQYLNQHEDMVILKSIQAEIARQFDLPLDPRGSPISRLHVMRMPYTKNSKTDRWTFPVRDLMTSEDVDYWSRQPELQYCYFKKREYLTINQLTNTLHLNALELDKETNRIKDEKEAAKIHLNSPIGAIQTIAGEF